MAKKILVIEDSPSEAAIVRKVFEEEGLEVDVATTGEEGVKKAVEMKPDLVLLDLILPDISGYEVCTKLKAEDSLSKTIIVVLSIKDDFNDIVKAFTLGVDDYIIKPPRPEFLAKKIKLYLGIR
jgi:DNA-binding response OmpR family regulator